jgi:hypothetical protein
LKQFSHQSADGRAIHLFFRKYQGQFWIGHFRDKRELAIGHFSNALNEIGNRHIDTVGAQRDAMMTAKPQIQL